MNYIQLSIIIPVFKVKDYVRKCLESVLAISNLNYEIIVVQDVHADNSLEDVPDLLNNPLIRICNQKNAGLSAARNAGLFLAKGEFVYFMDSDDYIDPIAFSNFFVRYYPLSPDILVGAFKYVNEKGQILNNPEDTGKIVQYSKEEALDKILQGKEINTSASMKLYCCDIFKNIRYPKGKLYEDVATTYKTILRANRVVYGDYSGYVYLCRGGSITKRKFTEKRMDAIYNMEEMCSNIIKAYPNLQGKCMVRLFEQYVSVYSAAKNSTGNKIIEKQIFGKLKDMRKRANVRGKDKVYSISIAIGKWLFDTIILVENSIQRYRKKI